MNKFDGGMESEHVRRCPGTSYQDLLGRDSRPVPDSLRIDQPAFLGDHDIPISRYLDAEYHELEKAKLWKKVWQVAVREERIPEVGDIATYEINDISIMIVRTAPGQIKAFYNACLHMGRQLIDRPCKAPDIRCPYHGFTWTLDGKLKHIPAMWDFPQIKAKEFKLPEIRTGLWGGFIFVNMDPDCEPLEDFLGDIDDHFRAYPLEERYTAAHLVKVVRANWKVAQEAFSDAYHVVGTHPQVLASMGDANSQYDTFGNYARAITPTGVPSPHLTWTPTEEDIAASAYNPAAPSGAEALKLPEGVSYRQHAAEAAREQFRQIIGEKADALCDAELMDSIFFLVFPNFHPFSSYNQVVQLFKPYGDRPDMCTMEIMYLAPFQGERPPPAQIRFLDAHESFLDAPEFGEAVVLMQQDEWNMERVQRGMHSLRMVKSGVTLSVYQQAMLRHFHNMYEQFLGLDETD